MDVLFQIIGWLGAIGLLTAFGLISRQKLSADSKVYQGMNLISAILLAANAVYIQSNQFILINVFWAAVALMSILKPASKSAT